MEIPGFRIIGHTSWNELECIKDGVKREVGVDAEEVEERVGRNDFYCLRFTRGSAICLLGCRFEGLRQVDSIDA